MRPRYANWLSWVLFRRFFRLQWVVPPPPPRSMERFLQWYERRFLRVDVSGIQIDRPIFLISMPRSGSSMLQDILCCHPDIGYTTNTMHIFRTCFCAAERLRRRWNLDVSGERFLRDSVPVDAGSASDPVAVWGDWLKEDPYDVKFTSHRLADFTPAEIENIRSQIKKMLWCFGGQRRFLCKNPALLPHVEWLMELFPDARIVYLARDGRQTANSMIKLGRLCAQQLTMIRRETGLNLGGGRPFIPYPRLPRLADYLQQYGADDIRTTAHLWDDSVRFIEERRARMPAFHFVRYEDILANPKEEILKILRFCELADAPESNRRFWDKVQSVGVVHHQNPDYGDFDTIEEICRDSLRKMGYAVGAAD